MSIIKQALNENLTTKSNGAVASSLIEGSTDGGVTSTPVKVDNNGRLEVKTTNEVEQTIWVDSTGTYFIRIYTNNLGVPAITYSLADGTSYVPVGATVPASSGSDKEVSTTHYQVITAGVGYSIGDLVNSIIVYDTNLNSVVSQIYYNLTTSAVITPLITELQEISERLSDVGINYDSVRIGDGTNLANVTANNELKVRSTPFNVATAVLSYRHAAILAVDTPSATLLTTGATGANYLQVLNNTGAIIEVNIGLTNPIIVGMGGSVSVNVTIPGAQAITITPRIIGLTATDYVTINVF